MRGLLLVWTLGATFVAAADPQVVVIEQSRGRFVVPVTATEVREVQKLVADQVNGQAQVRTVTERVPVSVTRRVDVDLRAGDFLDRAGRPMDPRAVAALVKKGTVLAVSADGTPVGPDVLKKNELVEAILLLKPQGHDQKGPAPNLGILERDRDGKIHVEVTIIEQVFARQTRTRRHNGRLVQEAITVPAFETLKVRYELADARVTDLGGNPVELKSLRPGTKVAVSADYQPVDPSHVHALKGVVAVVVPRDVPAP